METRWWDKQRGNETNKESHKDQEIQTAECKECANHRSDHDEPKKTTDKEELAEQCAAQKEQKYMGDDKRKDEKDEWCVIGKI